MYLPTPPSWLEVLNTKILFHRTDRDVLAGNKHTYMVVNELI